MDRYQESTEYLKARMPAGLGSPSVAVICGSGLGGLAGTVLAEPKTELNYASIPYFPKSTVQGHAGKLVIGKLPSMVPVILMVGRTHYYEGHDIQDVTFPIRVFRLLGVETIIVTNAAGGLNPQYAVGDIVLLHDHIFLAGLGGLHPLRGPNLDDYGVRFPSLSDAFDLALRRTAHIAWRKCAADGKERRLHEGVYAFAGGPSYETRAECRLLHKLGADLVGMSTVPEVIVARHCGIKVLAMSLVTNKSVLEPDPRGDDPLIQDLNSEQLKALDTKGKADHNEVIEESQMAALVLQRFVSQIVADLAAGG